jgi:hypothetical protein
MRRILTIAGALAILTFTLSPVSGQSERDQSDRDFVVIGCLRQAPHGGYLIGDYRGGKTLQVKSDDASPQQRLAWQVGHELELHGTVVKQPSDGALRMNVHAAIEIAPSCLANPS